VIDLIRDDKIQKNEEILYIEWVSVGKFVKAIFIFLLILIVSLGILFIAFMPIEMAVMGIIIGTLSFLIFLLYWNYRRLKIYLTRNQLEVSYGIFNHKKIPLNIITNCTITKASFRTYGGVGIRFGLDGSRVYNTDFGEAIKLTFRSGRPFVFSTRNPQKICDLISKLTN